MDNLLVIGIILVMMIILLVTGLYIHSVLLASGIIGLILLEGFGILPGLLGNEPFNRVASYTLTTIPLFVLMAQFILQSGLVQDIFYMVHKVSKGKNSLLGVLTLIIGGMLGAVSGSGTATSASLGQVAIPELRKHGYSAPLAGAIAASGGSLSGIIPPSIILILYGVATETPVGSLFVGAFIPGILTMVVFILVMLVYFQMDRKKHTQIEEPEIKDAPLPEKLSAIRLIVVSVIAVIIVLVIFGGIYSGIFTPTEAGAVGAFVGLLAALVLGKVNFQFFKTSVVETVKLTGMVMIIMIGAQIFGRFVSLSLLPRRLIELIEPIMDTPVLVLVAISVVHHVHVYRRCCCHFDVNSSNPAHHSRIASRYSLVRCLRRCYLYDWLNYSACRFECLCSCRCQWNQFRINIPHCHGLCNRRYGHRLRFDDRVSRACHVAAEFHVSD